MDAALAIATRDFRIATPRGGLHARQWHWRDERGDGRAPIVLFHDSLGCVALWRDFPERLALASGRNVVAYDRLGFGQSDPHPGRLAPDFVQDEARGGFRFLREALALEAFVAFGHSVGGGMAIACAAAHPAGCTALVTVSAQAFVEDRTLRGIRDAQRAFAQPEQRQRLRKYHGDKAEWVLSAWIDTWLAPEFADWNLDDALARVSCPVLAIHGDEDEYGSTAHPRRIVGLVQGPSTLRIMAGVGHVPHRERPTQTIAAVGDWLACAVDGSARS